MGLCSCAMRLRSPANLRGRPRSINSFLAPLAAILLGVGCASTPDEKEARERDKEASTIRLHMESLTGGLGTADVEVIRSNPTKIRVEKSAFVDEGFLARAEVVDTPPSGFAIRLTFMQRGALRLQMATAAGPGRRVAVWSRWDQGRWLAAPRIIRGIESGMFQFTPDATREEAERIVRGLNNVAIKLGNQPKPERPTPDNSDKPAKKPVRETVPDEGMFLPETSGQ